MKSGVGRDLAKVGAEQAVETFTEYGLHIIAHVLDAGGTVAGFIPHIGQVILALKQAKLEDRVRKLEECLSTLLKSVRLPTDAESAPTVFRILETTVDAVATDPEVEKIAGYARGIVAAFMTSPLDWERHRYFVDILRQITLRDIKLLLHGLVDDALGYIFVTQAASIDFPLLLLSTQRLLQLGLLDANQYAVGLFWRDQPNREQSYFELSESERQDKRTNDIATARQRGALPRISPFGESFCEYFALRTTVQDSPSN